MENSDESYSSQSSLPPSQIPPYQQPVQQQQNSLSNLGLVFVGAALLLFAIAAVIYVLNLSKSNNRLKTNKAVSPTIYQVTVSPTETMISKVPAEGNMTISPSPRLTGEKSVTDVDSTSGAAAEGYLKKETLCYTVFVPSDARVGDEKSCSQYITNSMNSKYVYVEHISPVFDSLKYKNLDDLVNKRIIDPNYNLVKSEDIVLDGIPAKKLIEVNNKLNLKLVRVFVYVPNRYKMSGVNIVGFEIRTTLDGNNNVAEQVHDKKIFDTLLSRWKWK